MQQARVHDSQLERTAPAHSNHARAPAAPGSNSRFRVLPKAWDVKILLMATPSPALEPRRQPSGAAIICTSLARVLFTTLLFVAGGMAVGLFCGIVGTVIYGMIKGGQIDMSNAYRHVAIPIALLVGTVALVGSTVLEVRSRTRTSL